MSSISNHGSLRNASKFSAIILAAGYSSRMGDFKPLLRVGDRSAIESVVRLFLNAGVKDVCVVVGYRANEVTPVAEEAGARCVMNPDYDLGMYSSVRGGVAALAPHTDACFIIPVDIPLVRVSTIHRLIRAFTDTKSIVFPTFQGKRGHPPLIARRVLAEILNSGNSARLSTLLAAYEGDACNVFVADEGVCLDMDTPTELAAIRELACNREIPTICECEALLAQFQPEDRVIRHSRVVADVAHHLALALAGKSVPVDPHLARVGGLLHDIAKGCDNHAQAGAKILQEMEFESVAPIVATHTDYLFDNGMLDEAAIVYLADKLVSGEQVVGLAIRFHNAIERFHDNPIALAAALRRGSTAEAVAKKVESCLGVGLQQVIRDASSFGQ